MTTRRIARPIEILLVDACAADRKLASAALASTQLQTRVHAVEDGVAALAFLRREDPYAAAPRPDLILLDFDLPRMDGRELLQTVKDDPLLRVIPVLVVTAASTGADIEHAYRLHANGLVAKPVQATRLAEAVESLRTFWFDVIGPQPAAQSTPTAALEENAPLPLCRLLFVEDSPTDFLIVGEMLSRSRDTRFEITRVERLSDAVEKLRDALPDAVLTDLSLPDSEGLATYQALRDAAPDTPIVVLTGTSDEALGRAAVQAGADDFLVKGDLSPQSLRRAVGQAIERRRA